MIDVLVIGLGPAGASAAAAAARAGARVVGIDRKHVAGVPVQCAEFVPAMLADAAVTAATRQPIRAMHTFVEDEAPDVQPDFPGRMLDRAAFDAALAADARACGADCRFGTAVRSIARDGRVLLTDGSLLEARTIVGADGPRSIVGRAIGQVNRHLVETRQITVPLVAAHAATDIFLSAGIPGGYGWLFPKGDQANLGAGVAPAHKSRLKAIVARLHRELVEAGRVGAEATCLTGGAIPVGGMLAPAGALGARLVLLAGDAAGLTNPITGAGIAAAVMSGRNAGVAAAQWLAGDATAALDYADELEAVFKPALDRAVARRRELAASARPDRSALRRAWIAYPEYWSR